MIQDISNKIYDTQFRKNLIAEPQKYAKELGYHDENVEYQISVCKKDTFYFVMDNEIINLENIDGGILDFKSPLPEIKNCVGTAGSVGCLCGTLSSAGTFGSARA